MLTLDTIKRSTPSVFAAAPWREVSDSYKFIPTSDVVAGLLDAGFEVASARQARTVTPGKREYVKHQLRFRRPQDVVAGRGEYVPEVLLQNSHDSAGAFVLMAGVFRFACFNGMFVGSAFGTYRKTHRGNVGDVIDAAYEVVAEFPAVIDQIERWRGLYLDQDAQLSFASAALGIRYGAEKAPLPPERLLWTRRSEDRAADLWTIFNRTQENLMQGGLPGRTTTGRRMHTRGISGISEETRVNRQLWDLAAAVADLQTAGLDIKYVPEVVA